MYFYIYNITCNMGMSNGRLSAAPNNLIPNASPKISVNQFIRCCLTNESSLLLISKGERGSKRRKRTLVLELQMSMGGGGHLAVGDSS